MKRMVAVAALVVLGAIGMATGWRRFATAAPPPGTEQVVHITAKRCEYTPSEITRKKGVPVILGLTALDPDHGVKAPEFGGPAAMTLILLATAATLVAAQSGEDAHVAVEAAPGIAAAVHAHQEWGERTRNVALLVGGLELLTLALRGRSVVRTMSFVSAGFGLLAFLCVLQTGKLGGELVYGHAGGVGIRSGDPEDVARLFLAGLFRQAELDEKAGRTGDAASLLELAAQRFPSDPAVQVRAAEALLEDRNDP